MPTSSVAGFVRSGDPTLSDRLRGAERHSVAHRCRGERLWGKVRLVCSGPGRRRRSVAGLPGVWDKWPLEPRRHVLHLFAFCSLCQHYSSLCFAVPGAKAAGNPALDRNSAQTSPAILKLHSSETPWQKSNPDHRRRYRQPARA